MYCQNRVTHTVQSGDSLYKLARQYQTSVTELILGNPGVNPYNLQIGLRLTICPGPGYEEAGMERLEENTEQNTEQNRENNEEMEDAVNRLYDEMRMAWQNHVFWTRMYLMSADADAKDQQAVEQRLLQTADEIADVFAQQFPVNIIRQLRNLLVEHIEIAGQIIAAIKSGNMGDYDTLIKNWYANANQIATLLGNQNSFFAGREARNMLLNHLDLTRQEIEQQLNGEYEQSIDTFRDIQNQAIDMADFFCKRAAGKINSGKNQDEESCISYQVRERRKGAVTGTQ